MRGRETDLQTRLFHLLKYGSARPQVSKELNIEGEHAGSSLEPPSAAINASAPIITTHFRAVNDLFPVFPVHGIPEKLGNLAYSRGRRANEASVPTKTSKSPAATM